jgi:hypothetical protein
MENKIGDDHQTEKEEGFNEAKVSSDYHLSLSSSVPFIFIPTYLALVRFPTFSPITRYRTHRYVQDYNQRFRLVKGNSINRL